ncbi:hypothetical protein [Burkholderia sp. MSMB617WGS]|uniref:hypothetical protein n=1 Tax=Burkholderia sp. MSMB617WGS TaxID=1637831 RepID=UPI0011AE51A9|nr:hypothetical protein [Burkholderia sp. MSMB617WGS]
MELRATRARRHAGRGGKRVHAGVREAVSLCARSVRCSVFGVDDARAAHLLAFRRSPRRCTLRLERLFD